MGRCRKTRALSVFRAVDQAVSLFPHLVLDIGESVTALNW